jgi:hypothetical protein
MVVLLAAGCRASSQDSRLNEIFQTELGVQFSIELNSSKSFALGWKQEGTNVSYAVVQLSTYQVIIKNMHIHATVTWHNNLQIKETSKPEVIRKEGNAAQTSKLINVNDYLVNSK